MKNINHEIHHHCKFDKTIEQLFIWLIVLLFAVTMISLLRDGIGEQRDLYNECLDACTEDPFGWTQEVPDDFGYNDGRVECIRVCNSIHFI